MGTFVHGIRSRGSGTAPTEKIVLHSPLGSRRFNAHDDAGSLTSGLVVYRTGTTQANDMTVSNADHGQSDNESVIYVVEIVDSDIHKAQNWDLTTAYSANDPIIVRELQYGDQFWAKGSTLTVVEDTCYFLEANG
ncbi:MAG: hypothetical protein GY834_09880, partial [Bacteroidetes bacterium]|nr:hypothetical protein [Bacteroidota bacterium]